MNQAFPSATVHGSYRKLIRCVPDSIDPKDRHVVAAAVRCNAELIVTYNRRHFPSAALEELGIQVHGPSTFLIRLFDLDRTVVMRKLTEQAESVGIGLADLLSRLQPAAPTFVSYLREELSSLSPYFYPNP